MPANPSGRILENALASITEIVDFGAEEEKMDKNQTAEIYRQIAQECAHRVGELEG